MDSGAPRPRAGRIPVMLTTLPLLLLFSLVALLEGPPAAAATTTKVHHHPPPTATAIGQPAPAPMNSAAAVSCGDVRHCWAVGLGTGTTAAIDATADGGVSWAGQSVPAAVTALAGVSCFDRLHCLAVGAAGAAGAVLATKDGGRVWRVASVPTGAAAVTAVDCTAKARCVVLATDGTSYWSASTSNQGRAWSRGGSLPAAMSAAGLDCPTAANCLAAGFAPTGPGRGAGAIATSADGGATWAPATLPSGVGILRDVTCTIGLCVAAGTPNTATTGFVPAAGQLVTSLDGGSTWQLVAVPVGRDDAFGVDCPNAKTCVTVGTDWIGTSQPVPSAGIVSTFDGGTVWRAADLKYVPVGMSSIDCPVLNRCVAAGGNVLVRISLPVSLPKPKPKPSPRNRPGAGLR